MALFKRRTRLEWEMIQRQKYLSPGEANTFGTDIRNFLFWLVPHYFGSLILLVLLWVILSNGVGETLGLSNIFRDRPDVQTSYVGANWNSPTFWTSAIVFFSSCLIVVFPAFDNELDSGEGRPGFRPISRRRGLWFFGVGVLAVYGFLTWTWIHADQSTPVEGERWRVPFGAVAGAVVFWLCYQFGKLLRALLMRIVGLLHDGKVDRREAEAYEAQLPTGAQSSAPTSRLKRQHDGRDNFLKAMDLRQMSRQTGLKLALVLPMWLVILIAFFVGNLIPAVALLSLILFLFLSFKLIWVLPLPWRSGLFGCLVVLSLVAPLIGLMPEKTGHDVFKHAFDGIRDVSGDDHYDNALNLDAVLTEPRDCDLEGSARSIALRDTLEAWHTRQVRLTGNPRPKLVFVATSGGAYRASYWTTLVLDRLIQENVNPDLAGIADSVRLITGASGGMVGAAYFAALATENATMASQAGITQALSRDILISQFADPSRQRPEFYPTRYPVPRDSLSGVAQHLLQQDLKSIFTFGLEPHDRGKVLENHWRELAVPMSAFAEGEREGWRPSLIFAPMIVETGQQLLISNLDLTILPAVRFNEAVDMFQWFPCARDSFRVGTAVRMNATFPLISPAVSLPTSPKRRVVDAGYYDNYGVSLLNALLSQSSAECVDRGSASKTDAIGPFCLREWVRERTSGILLLEIRAFGLGTEGELGDACEPVPVGSADSALAFLTSPVEAVLAARSRAMVFQNEQGRRRIGQMDPDLRVNRVVFAHCGGGSMNWILPPDEFEAMEAALDIQWDENRARLIEAWNSD